MTLRDTHGQALSTTRNASADANDHALFNSFGANPLAVIETALADEPGFVTGRLMQAGRPMRTPERMRSVCRTAALLIAAACGACASVGLLDVVAALTDLSAAVHLESRARCAVSPAA